MILIKKKKTPVGSERFKVKANYAYGKESDLTGVFFFHNSACLVGVFDRIAAKHSQPSDSGTYIGKKCQGKNNRRIQ